MSVSPIFSEPVAISARIDNFSVKFVHRGYEVGFGTTLSSAKTRLSQPILLKIC